MMRRAPIRISVVLASAVLAACTHVERPAPGKPVTTATRIERLSVLTYNVLHGLEVSGWSVGPAESKEEQRTRFNLQARKLSLAQPDVLLLQEVNPLPEKADAYVTALTTSGSQYTEVHQADACGIRLFGLRIIPGLNNGMAILAKAPLRLRKVAGLKLSGGLGGCGDFFGLQLGELRYALIAEVENPTTGNKLLAVSVHLHSGIERTSYFLRRIADAEEQGELRREVLQDFVAALEEDQNRRLGEIRVLVKELSRLHAENERYLGVIVGGDFNFEPDSLEYRALRQAGLRDTYTIPNISNYEYSYDPMRNPLVGHEEAALPRALRGAMTGLSEEERQRIAEGYRRGMGQARRIDYLFHMGKPPNIPQECLRQELLGTPAAVVAKPASDHYGVMNTYILDPTQC
ncbi:endonuclease/exonuclease/phosphatase family protein [Nitrospira sp. BLG_2]|uniref:endonuclease/exonuclease/phosphatase family protein n=1 Tax=Nitrospira sp. BLG_2 TaxID=3397507 RepID=UPI003B9C89BC